MKLNEGERTVMQWLISHSLEGRVSLHSKDVERKIIPDGQYCLSVSKYIRNLRSYGYIEYLDPRSHEHIYHIQIKRDIDGHVSPPVMEIQEYIQLGLMLGGHNGV